jgi:hypothetical protein
VAGIEQSPPFLLDVVIGGGGWVLGTLGRRLGGQGGGGRAGQGIRQAVLAVRCTLSTVPSAP